MSLNFIRHRKLVVDETNMVSNAVIPYESTSYAKNVSSYSLECMELIDCEEHEPSFPSRRHDLWSKAGMKSMSSLLLGTN